MGFIFHFSFSCLPSFECNDIVFVFEIFKDLSNSNMSIPQNERASELDNGNKAQITKMNQKGWRGLLTKDVKI